MLIGNGPGDLSKCDVTEVAPVPKTVYRLDHERFSTGCARNSDHLALRIGQFLTLNPEIWRRIAQASRTKAEREFDERVVIAGYFEVIDRITGRKPVVPTDAAPSGAVAGGGGAAAPASRLFLDRPPHCAGRGARTRRVG